MKKTVLFLTLFIAMLTFGVRAQIPVLTEGFEGTAIPAGWTTIDADQDGHGWEHSTLQEEITGHTGDASVVSYSYDNPTNLALTPDNWLISPAITLNGTSSLSYWFVVAQSYPGDHYGVYISTTSATDTSAFTLLYEMTPTSANGAWTQNTIDLTSYAGNTVYIAFRHFNCTDMFIIALDDITVSTVSTEAVIAASPSSVNFGIVNLGDVAVQTVDVTAYNNTTPISVTVTAPFAVSADSITFGTSATLPATGGVLYVQYTPVDAGENSTVMTLTAGTLNATVSLSGTALDCSPLALPYTETFEATSSHLACWLTEGDAAWSIGTGDYSTATGAFEGSTNAKITHSSSGNVTKLISPAFAGVNNGLMLHFAYVMRSWAGDIDELRVYSRSTADGAWQQVAEYTAAVTSWTVENVAIPGTVYQIAFEMTDHYGYGVGIDSVVFEEMAADFCAPVVNLVADNITTTGATLSWTGDAASYTILDMSNASVVATQSGTSYDLTGLTAMTYYTYGVVANCTSSNSDTVVLSFATACEAVTLPYTETFNATSPTRGCWELVSMNTGNAIGTNYGMGFYTVSDREVLRFSSYSNHGGSNDYNQYGFSPLMNVSSTATFLNVSVTYATYNSSNKLYFGYVTATDTVWDPTEYTTGGSSDWQTVDFVIPTTATQLAVNYYGNYSYYAWIDSVVVTELTGDYCFPVNTLAANNITAHTASISWSGDANTYTILNMNNDSVLATVSDSVYTITGLASETQYTIGVVANCTSGSSDTVTVTFTTQISCPVPTGLDVTLTPGNGTVATLSWTENGTATAWQICVNDDETNLIDATSTTYNFTGLTAEQAYTVKVRANCDVNDQSAWSSSVTFTPTNAYFITVNDGTTTNNCVPIYGLWVDDITKSQFIIPAADLAAMQYGSISKLTFYSSNANVNWGVAEFNVYLTETADTAVSALADYSSMTQVYAGTLSISDNKMEVAFNTPYLYMGGNLMVGFLQTVSGTYSSSYWYGVSAIGASMGGYGTSISQRDFLPKTTISYTPGTAPSCLPVTGLTVSNVTDSEVTLTWTGTAASYSIYEGSNFVANVTTTSYTVTGLTPASDYVFGVVAVCSATDSSIVSNVSASTECGAVTTYPYVQDFSTAPACWVAIDADGDGNNWILYQGTIQSASYSGGALTPDNWLVSPQFAIPATGNYEVTWTATAQDQSWPAEHYGVFVSTTGIDTANFTMLQEWTLGTGLFNPVVDLSAYAGQNIYIALRHFNCTDQFRLSIDEFIVREQAGANQVTINVGPNNPAYGTVAGGGIYNIGDNVTVSATPSTGYNFSKWVDENNNVLSTDNPYTFVAATNLNLTAIFLDNAGTTYTITVNVNDSTMGTATGAGTYTAGDQVTLVATPFAGYAFVNWTQISGFGENVVGTDASLIITVTGDKTFVANFEADSTVVEPCDAPTGLTVGAITHESIVVSWDNADVTGWNLRYRVQNGTWTSTTSTTNSYTISGLAPETTYEIQVQANCGNGNQSDWTSSVTATTTVGINSWLENSVSLYPNPAREYVDIRVDGDLNVSMMEVYDVYGKLINTVTVVENPTRINVNGLANGMYFVRVTTEAGVVTKSFIKK